MCREHVVVASISSKDYQREHSSFALDNHSTCLFLSFSTKADCFVGLRKIIIKHSNEAPPISRSLLSPLESPELTGVGLESPELTGVGLESPELTGVGLESPELTGVGLESPELTGVGLESPELTGVGLESPELTRAGLESPELTRVGLESHIFSS